MHTQTRALATTPDAPQWLMVVLFAAMQLGLSQLPNLESVWLVSAVVRARARARLGR